MIVKIRTLNVETLKQLLREKGLSTLGVKVELVARLMDFTGTDEIMVDDVKKNSINDPESFQSQLDSLKAMMEQIMTVVTASHRDTDRMNTDGKCDLVNSDENTIRQNENISINSTHVNVYGSNSANQEANADGNVAPIGTRCTENVRDIVSILPEFNPLSNDSLNSQQFIKRIEMLKNAYNWSDNTLLFVVQQKLLGPARLWIDSQKIFVSWQEFKDKFLRDFPCSANMANVHIKMTNTRRQLSETPQNYYYKMLAMGEKAGLAEEDIVHHIINGINDSDLRKTISRDYKYCNELLHDINKYCEYNTIRNERTGDNVGKRFNVPSTSNHQPVQPRTDDKRNSRDVKCFNCHKIGHYSIKCPEPQRRQRCTYCQRTSHQSGDCPQRSMDKSGPIVNKIGDGKRNGDVLKQVKIKGKDVVAFVDCGSQYSLIEEEFGETLGASEKCSVLLSGFAGGKYLCSKCVTTEIDMDGLTFLTKLYMVDVNHIPEKILLGRDVLCRTGNRLVIEGDDCWIEDCSSLNVDNSLGRNEMRELKQIVGENRRCFAMNASELGRCTLAKMSIKLTTDEPINLRPYRVPFAKRPLIADIIQDLLNNEIIRPSTSPYASPVVLVEKSNGEHRLCVDFRKLNQITVKTPYPMPIVEEQFAQLSGNVYFTTLDLRMGYHQIEIDEQSKQYTGFVTTEGHYEYNRMPFGLVNAPACFQMVMNKIANEMNREEILVYLDDVIIPSRTVSEGLSRLNKFLGILHKHGLTLRLDKCNFLRSELEYLGHVVNGEGIRPGERKISAIRNFKQPSNITEIRRFIGLTGFFRKFVPNYSLVSRPLTELLQKSRNGDFIWTDRQQTAFRKLIDLLCDAPVLELYDQSAVHEIHTDASSLGLAGILLQSHDGKSFRPVIYFSRHCTSAEQKYHSYELEVLAVVESLDRFRIYVLGKHFRLVTDCSAVAKVRESKELKPRIARWWMRILEYDFEVIHRPGSNLAHVDALSRSPDEAPISVEPAGFVFTVAGDINDWVVTMQLQDNRLNEIFAILNEKVTSPQSKQIRKEYELKNHRLYRREPDGLRLVVPKAVRWRIVKHFHDDMGHFATEKTLQRLKTNFWFPRMRKYVREYINACISCFYNRTQPGKPQGQLHFDEPEPVPFRLIHLDHLGPFVRSRKGNVHILAISDAFSKFLIVKAVRSTKTAPVINALNEVISYFGLPTRVVTDRGTAFTSRLFEDYCRNLNINHVKTAVRTPRANGQVERANGLILNYLRTSTTDAKDWDMKLRDFQWIVNSQVNSTTGFSPNDLIFSYKPNDVVHNHLVAAIQLDIEKSDTQSPDGKRCEAAENIARERNKWKRRFDERHSTPRIYHKGDLVVVANEPAATGESRKLEPRFKGPYVISRELGNDRYLIEDIPGLQVTSRKFCSVFSCDKLKPWCSQYPELDNDSLEDDDDDTPPEVEDDLPSGMAELSTLT